MRPSRDSTTDGPANRRSGERKCTSFDRFAHPLREGDRSVQCGTGQDQHELLAAVAAHPVDLPRVVAQDLGELAQHLITSLMPVRVVDTLEHVEIAHDARERLIEAERVLERLVQPFLEAPAVVRRQKNPTTWDREVSRERLLRRQGPAGAVRRHPGASTRHRRPRTRARAQTRSPRRSCCHSPRHATQMKIRSD